MHIRNLNMVFMLIAGIIVGIFSLLYSYSTEKIMYTMGVVLVLFFVIGTIIQHIINKIIEKTIENETAKIKKALEEKVHSLEDESPE